MVKDKLILSIETSTSSGSVAITTGDVCVAELFLQDGMSLSKKLFNMIETVMKYAGITYASLDAVALSCGPGSFTGLRMGMSTAKSIAFSLSIPFFAVPTFEIMLESLPDQLPFIVQPFIDARKNEVYTASFQWSEEKNIYATLKDDANIKTPVFISNIHAPVFLLGDISLFKADKELHKLFVQKCENKDVIIKNIVPKASDLGSITNQKIKKGENPTLFEVSPYYIRKSDAEIKKT